MRTSARWLCRLDASHGGRTALLMRFLLVPYILFAKKNSRWFIIQEARRIPFVSLYFRLEKPSSDQKRERLEDPHTKQTLLLLPHHSHKIEIIIVPEGNNVSEK